MVRYSRQREMIYNYLKGTKSHPTAEQIYSDLKPHAPALSLATVYRNLNLLCEMGQVQKLDTGESTDRFDADVSDHSHFICEKCHTVTDLFDEVVNHAEIQRALGENYIVKHHKLYLYGICGLCDKQHKN